MTMDVQIAWQVVAIWVIVASTIVWFVRDERRLESEKLLARAARHHALAPRRRQIIRPVSIPLPRPRPGAIRHSDRIYFDRFLGGKPRR